MKCKILDCTLRDGSYVNNFQFSAKEAYGIVQNLESSKVEMIEVGHGIGLGASRGGYSKSRESDEMYMRSASRAIKESKWGVFCIPGIASLDDLILASDFDMDFIRIGVEPDNINDAIPFIEKSKELGFSICLNFMKSYNASPKQFKKYVKQVDEFQIEYVYIVDSAGCMTPKMVKEYVKEVKNFNIDQKIGFHGHNNLGMAIANSLVAIDSGVDIVDATLMGMGRGGGNACFEQLVAILLKNGESIKIDPLILGKISERYITKYLKNQSINILDIASGIAEFHSSYMPLINKVSFKYKIHPADLIIKTSCLKNIAITKNLIENIAKKLTKKTTLEERYKKYYGNEHG